MTDPETIAKAIVERLSRVIDPETGVDVIHMRLIEDLQVDENGVVSYTFRPSSPFCPIAVPLSLAIQQAVADVPGVSKQNMEIVDLFLQEDLIEYLKEAMKDYNQ